MNHDNSAMQSAAVVGFQVPVRQTRPQSAVAKQPTKSILKTKSSQQSIRNNFEHSRSRKAILKHALAEIEQEIESI